MIIKVLEPLGVKKEKLDFWTHKMAGLGHQVISYPDRKEDMVELIERSQDADIAIIANMPYRAEVIKACEKLKMVSVAFTGVDHLAVDACKEKNIAVSNASGYSNIAVAELAFGLMLGLYRNILPCDVATRAQGTQNGLIGNELYGKTIGVIGTGEIGTRVIEIAQVFGCKILAYSRTIKESLVQKGVKYVSLDNLMAESDIVTLHVPLNESTKHLITEELIHKMKKTAILINTARGSVVDIKALAKALKQQVILGAGIDVFEIEPPLPKDHPLIDCPNTILTPHVAFASKEALERRIDIVFENIIAWLKGEEKNRIV